MIRTLIVDDEPLARRHVRDLLAGHGDFELVGEAGHGGEAIARIEELRPDLVFLDIQMPETGGFDVIDAIGVLDLISNGAAILANLLGVAVIQKIQSLQVSPAHLSEHFR